MSEKPSGPRKMQIQIKLDEDIASGVYANMAMVNHTDAEFTIDFIHLQPQAPVAKVRIRRGHHRSAAEHADPGLGAGRRQCLFRH